MTRLQRLQTLLGLEGKLRLLETVWLLGPLVLWFSYWPVIALGQDSTSYYELSPAVLYVFTLALFGILSIWRARVQLIRDSTARLVGGFVVLSAVTLIFSPNLLRGFLTFCVIVALYLVLLTGLAERQRFKVLAKPLAILLVASAVCASIIAIMQVIAGIWFSGNLLLLCQGCTAQQFGFVRPNVFAIEPQFFGSLLLAPLIIAAHAVLSKEHYKLQYLSTSIIAMALFLTLSRGAIFAFVIGLLVLIFVHRRQFKKVGALLGLLLVSFIASLSLQGTAAALNNTVDTTFRQAISASINQLSLGTIILPVVNEAPVAQSDDFKPEFDGYVEESTTVRVNLSVLALSTWFNTPLRMFFGVGLGGSGVALHAQYPASVSEREIVQNQYVEYLLEYGLVGVTIVIIMIAGLFMVTRQARWTWALLVSYLAQWFFFSGYPNALHVYLVLIAAVLICGDPRVANRIVRQNYSIV